MPMGEIVWLLFFFFGFWSVWGTRLAEQHEGEVRRLYEALPLQSRYLCIHDNVSDITKRASVLLRVLFV